MPKLTAQMVGRLGELAVERELLKRGWMVGNFNASLPNTMAYDLFAVKGARRICLRVKATSGDAIQYTARKDGTIFRSLTAGDDGDFVVIVLMEGVEAKEFYIVPTQVVKDKLIAAHRAWHKGTKRDGTPRKVTQHRALEFGGKGTSAPHRGMRIKWGRYQGAWSSLA